VDHTVQTHLAVHTAVVNTAAGSESWELRALEGFQPARCCRTCCSYDVTTGQEANVATPDQRPSAGRRDCRETSPADVRALPEPARLGLVGSVASRGGRSAPQHRSCLPCVQTRRSGWSTARLRSRSRGRGVLIAAELGAEEPAAALGRGAQKTRGRRRRFPGASDEQRLGRAQSLGALTQMLLDGYRPVRCRKARRDPRLRGTRRGSSFSTRLAVAPSGSAFSRETSEQGLCLSLWRSICSGGTTTQITWPVFTGWPGRPTAR